MRHSKALLALAAAGCLAMPAHAEDLYWGRYGKWADYDRTIIFNHLSEGTSLPILWGFDTAWNDYGNMLRGLRHCGTDAVEVARVSFQPWAKIETKGVLPELLQKNLEARMATVALAGHKVDIVLNLDGGEPTIKEVYGGLDENNKYVGDPQKVAEQYALLIDATVAAVQEMGYNVVTVSPFNEPDYPWNGTPILVFDLINKELKNFDKFPRMRDIRISGGNTLNCDSAYFWYDTLKANLDEGNTHQLAGDFNHYSDFFTKVREDGNHATADELHNVMEAMVGVEYGMQTGIWWGSATRTRGDYMKASFGKRLAYSENRDAWSAASVYRTPAGKLQGFVGCSERQAKPSTFNFVSTSGDFFVNGYGPFREYVASIPGDKDGAYMTAQQRNAEAVLDIETGIDIRPAINGSYSIINGASHKAVSSIDGTTDNGKDIVQRTFSGASDQYWNVTPVPEDIGGDFAYWHIRNTSTNQALDDNNWNMEIGGRVISYGPSNNGVQLWTLEYAGQGWYRIRNMQSGLYLEVADNTDGTRVLQQEFSDKESQLWRFVAEGVTPAFATPATPAIESVNTTSLTSRLKWTPSEGMTYSVFRADDGGEFSLVTRGIDAGEFADNGLVNGHSYSYKIMAEDASGNRSSLSEAKDTECKTTGLVASFLFPDEVVDSSANNFSFRTSAKFSYAAGRDNNRAFYLRRSQSAQLPYNVIAGDEFSIALFAYQTSITGGYVIFRTGLTEDDSMVLYETADGTLHLRGADGSEATGGKLPAGEWHHIAISCNGTTARLYVDGVEATGEVTGIPADRLLTYLGHGFNGIPDSFIGRIDNLNIYANALTPDEVLADMGGTSAVGTIEASTEIVKTEYFSIDGLPLAEPSRTGVTIVLHTLSDGSVKIVRKVR